MKKLLKVKKQGVDDVLFKRDILDESIITVGNNPNATLQLKSETIAPEQFVIIAENEQLILMNRADGTFINGEIVDLGSRVELSDGDRIDIGNYQVFFVAEDGMEAEESIPKDNALLNIDNKAVDTNHTQGKNFSAVLNSVREEDSFYFQIIDKEGVVERVFFDSDEIWLGTLFAENTINKSVDKLDEVFARVQKDWSGAIIYPETDEELYLNGELIEEPHRLKNEDEIILKDDFARKSDTATKITFHEPVALLALNSILPVDLPEPVSLKSLQVDKDRISPNKTKHNEKDVKQKTANKADITQKKHQKIKKPKYFSLLEILIMAVGTLITAVLIFLVLEFV